MMRKFKILMMALFAVILGVSAQTTSTENYNGNSRFDDNWSVRLQTGYSTWLEDPWCHGSSAHVINFGLEKMVTPWFGLEPEFKVLLPYDNDAMLLNVGLNAKINLANIYNYDGNRKLFEPSLFVGAGYARVTDIEHNSATLRSGIDLAFNIGDSRSWAIVVSPQFAWYDLSSRNISRTTMLEILAGVSYHFMTSNGTHSFTNARLRSESEINELNSRINDLRKLNEELEMKYNDLKNKPVEIMTITEIDKSNQYVVSFDFDSYDLSNEARLVLDKVPAGMRVNVYGATSPEGTTKHNIKLSENRAKAVAEYLKSRGVQVNDVAGTEHGRVSVVVPVN